jgi:DHA1 family bicyclomycin/chloramphenicol resistance-like MFS transporter
MFPLSQPDNSPRKTGRVFALALGLIALIPPLAVHLFLPVIPAVKAALGLTEARAQLTFSIALFGMAFATLIYGALSDRYGRRPVLLTGLTLFMIGGVVSAIATTADMLILGRLVQAIGAGCAMTLARSIARDAYRADQLVAAIAYLTMFSTVGPMVSPFVGGLLIDSFGWRSVFAFVLLAGGAITVTVGLVIHETLPPAKRVKAEGGGFVQSYVALFRRLRFNAFVLQTGFNSGAFMVMASASASLMTDALHRPAAEFGLYFLLFPVGFFVGNVVSSRVRNRASTETMVLIASVVTLVCISAQAGLLWFGLMTPLVLFVPGFFLSLAQGIGLPYTQVGAMAEIPRFAGTAAGIGVFMQNFCGALFSQVYGLFADGTTLPMIVITLLCGALCMAAGVVPMAIKLRGSGATPA